MVSVSATASASRTAAARVAWLRNGSRGAEVIRLQRELSAAGFSPGKADGIFGPRTEAAVKALQRSRRLTVDGIVGPQTWGSLLKDGKSPGTAGGGTGGTGGTSGTGGVSGVGNLPKTGNAFIDSVASGAVASRRQYGVPASVTIAQAILESGWGKSSLTQRAFNLFGVKGQGPAGSMTVPTKEFINGQWITINAAFRRYHNFAESMSDHGRLLATSK